MATEKWLVGYNPITFESFTRHCTKHREPNACQYDMGYVDAVDNIEDWLKANAVEVMEVVHGRWEVIEASDELYRCSACGEWQFIPEEHFAYCPYCGAKMDGDGNG